MYIISQDYILSEAVLSRVLIGVDLGLPLSALFRFFTRVVSLYNLVLNPFISELQYTSFGTFNFLVLKLCCNKVSLKSGFLIFLSFITLVNF